MAHPRTQILEQYNINRHEVKDGSWEGLVRLIDDASTMFGDNAILFAQLERAHEMAVALMVLLEEWNLSSGRKEHPDPMKNIVRDIGPLDYNRMIDQLQSLMETYVLDKPKVALEKGRKEQEVGDADSS